MNLIDKKKEFLKQERGVSEHFPVTNLCTPAVFETKNGALGAVLKIKGVPYVTATDDELNLYQRQVHQMLLKLNYEFILYETVVRRKKNIALDGGFNEPFAQRVNDKYHARFKNQSLFINDLYITLIYRNEKVAVSKKSIIDKVIQISKKIEDRYVIEARQEARHAGIKVLENKVSEISSMLSCFGVSRLGENDRQLGYSELISFLSLVPNGGEPVRLYAGLNSVPYSKDIKTLPKMMDLYPNGHLGQYVCNKRLFFGENIQFQGNTQNHKTYASMLSLKHYSPTSVNVMLDPLLSLDGEFILTQTFAPIDKDHAIKDIKRCHAMKMNADDLSVSQMNELGDLADLVSSDRLCLGFHHNSLMLMSNTQKQLDKLINEASKAYSMANMTLIRESFAQIPAFFSQIVGNAHAIARLALITSENFADFCSLHNAQTGHHQSNFLNSAVTLFETPSRTPVFGNWHDKGSKTNPSRGHGLIIGGNDSGKTTMVAFLDAQMNRFENHRSVFLDRNNGLKIHVLAMGGQYTTINPKYRKQCAMNPLQLEDTDFNRDFCKSWFEALLLREGESSLPGGLSKAVNEAIDYCFDVLKKEQRTLTHVAQFFPVNFERNAELALWLKGSDDKTAGKYAWLFDNKVDQITLSSHRIGFDITYILDNFSNLFQTPVYMYIMHRIELFINGEVTSIVVDEMWQILAAPYWMNWLKKRLPSIRKDGGHIVGMTQSPKTIAESPINSELLDNVATIIFFPNPKAQRSVYVNVFGLSEAEFEFIKNTSPETRLFLYQHDNESIVCRLDLSDLSDEIRVFSGNKNSVRIADELIAEGKENWLECFIERSKS